MFLSSCVLLPLLTVVFFLQTNILIRYLMTFRTPASPASFLYPRYESKQFSLPKIERPWNVACAPGRTYDDDASERVSEYDWCGLSVSPDIQHLVSRQPRGYLRPRRRRHSRCYTRLHLAYSPCERDWTTLQPFVSIFQRGKWSTRKLHGIIFPGNFVIRAALRIFIEEEADSSQFEFFLINNVICIYTYIYSRHFQLCIHTHNWLYTCIIKMYM